MSQFIRCVVNLTPSQFLEVLSHRLTSEVAHLMILDALKNKNISIETTNKKRVYSNKVYEGEMWAFTNDVKMGKREKNEPIIKETNL